MDSKNKKPSTYTVLYWLIQDKKIEPDVIFNFLEFFWPTFLRKDKYVFLQEKYSEEEFHRLIHEKANPEYWINLLTIDDFFSEIENGEEKSAAFAKALVEMWEAKLKRDFPSINFIVEYLCDEEYGDYGLTFYQNMNSISDESNQTISKPNIKKNNVSQSPNGPRPGKPEIKKPKSDEIPKDA